MYTVQEFCQYVEDDINGLIEEVAGITRVVSDEERKAWATSYSEVSKMLSLCINRRPEIGQVHISTSNLLLEYKLPAASAWCDLVLVGAKQEKKQVVIVELKNWLKSSVDQPGEAEGLIDHNGQQHLHPSEQVKEYTEYCQRFHSAVQEQDATVSGCVYFSQAIDLNPYTASPNNALTQQYPLYNTQHNASIADYILDHIDHSDEHFAREFENGYYKQDRNILNQVAANFKNAQAKPFVLLDEQRRGFAMVMNALQKRLQDGKKQVIIVVGPPGCGKSAVAINVWTEAVMQMKNNMARENFVFVTTSSTQNKNWEKIFNTYGGSMLASGLVHKSNDFNPGMNGNSMKNKYLPIFADIDYAKYVNPQNDKSLRYEHFRDYVKYMIEKGETRNYKENQYFLSVVDEAHALINPVANQFRTNNISGWCLQVGPQGYHIIYKSQVSIFFMDGKQSFRDNESTSMEDIQSWAKELGAEVEVISLEGMQFRCAGSTEYVEWVEHLFTNNPLKNHAQWKDHFQLNICEWPSDMEQAVRSKMESTGGSGRLLSSFSREWVSKKLTSNHSGYSGKHDFVLNDKEGKLFKKYWNNPRGYEIFVQATEGSSMYNDPLCEVGCPYVVRGFDYDYIGLLWLEDVVWRNGEWYFNIDFTKETGCKTTRSAAVKEYLNYMTKRRACYTRSTYQRLIDTKLLKGYDAHFPKCNRFFNTLTKTYRILLTRAIKGIYIYVANPETRKHLQDLLS